MSCHLRMYDRPDSVANQFCVFVIRRSSRIAECKSNRLRPLYQSDTDRITGMLRLSSAADTSIRRCARLRALGPACQRVNSQIAASAGLRSRIDFTNALSAADSLKPSLNNLACFPTVTFYFWFGAYESRGFHNHKVHR